MRALIRSDPKSSGFDVGLEQAFARPLARDESATSTTLRGSDRVPEPDAGGRGCAARGRGGDGLSAPTSTRRRSTRRASSFRRTPPSARLRLGASYTFLDAEVTEAFGGGAAFNPAFPRFRSGPIAARGRASVPAAGELGSLLVGYTTGPFDVALSGYFSGRRDGSTFLSDGFFGNSMLLPNQDLDRATRSRPQRLLSFSPARAGVHHHRQPAESGLLGGVRVPLAAATIRFGLGVSGETSWLVDGGW